MRADLHVVAALAVLAGPAAAQQTTPQPADEAPPRLERTATSETEDKGPVGNFLDWLKRHADEPQPGTGDYWKRPGRGEGEGGGGGNDGGGDGGGGGGHGG